MLQKLSRIASNANLVKGGEELRKELLERLIDCRLVGATTQISFQSDPQRLAMRELPHGSWSNVYLLYLSYCKTQGLDPASRSTFFGVSQQWRACLRFHKKSQHQVCETCSRLKSNIQNTKESHQRYVTDFVFGGVLKDLIDFLMSKLIPSLCLGTNLLDQDVQEHVRWCDALLHHYTRTWQDRQIYYLARQRAKVHGDILVLIIDSYDRAKVTLPRYPFQRTPKKPVYERVRRNLTAQRMESFSTLIFFQFNHLSTTDRFYHKVQA